MEDDLKIFKVENLSKHWSDLPQMLSLSFENQTKHNTYLKQRQPRNVKIEYLSNHWLDLSQILNLNLENQNK